MLDKNNISKIGMGSWGLGGFALYDKSVDINIQIDSIIYILNNGVNFIGINNWYSEGKAVEIVSKAIIESGIKREDLFIVLSSYTYTIKSLEDSRRDLLIVLDKLSTDYIDSFHLDYDFYRLFGESQCLELNGKLLDENKIKNVSMCNAPFEATRKIANKYKSKYFGEEVGFNFEIRENYDLGSVPFNEEIGAKNIINQPLRRNRTAKRNWPLLVDLSKKYGATQNQIILAWMISHKSYLPIIKSTTKEHIDENLGALDLVLEEDDIKKIDEFRPPNYISPKIDWDKTGDGVRIDQLSNVFDENYDS